MYVSIPAVLSGITALALLVVLCRRKIATAGLPFFSVYLALTVIFSFAPRWVWSAEWWRYLWIPSTCLMLAFRAVIIGEAFCWVCLPCRRREVQWLQLGLLLLSMSPMCTFLLSAQEQAALFPLMVLLRMCVQCSMALWAGIACLYLWKVGVITTSTPASMHFLFVSALAIIHSLTSILSHYHTMPWLDLDNRYYITTAVLWLLWLYPVSRMRVGMMGCGLVEGWDRCGRG